MVHGRKEVLFVGIIMFTLHPDALSLNGSVMIINQSINQVKWHILLADVYEIALWESSNTVSLINYCCNTSASHCERSINDSINGVQ